MVNPLTVTHEQRLLIAELIGDRTHSDLSIEQGRFRLANSIANIMLAKGDTSVYNRKWPWADTWVDHEAQHNHQVAT